jgi:hypothetical protein
MSTAAKIIANPVEEIVRMVRIAAKRQLKHGDTRYTQRAAAALHRRAADCGCQHNTCGGCVVLLAVAAELEAAP